jgi:hypothetical protein
VAFDDVDARRQRLTATDDFTVFADGPAHIAEVRRRTPAPLIIATVIGTRFVAMIVAVVIAITAIALRTAWLAVVLMLARARAAVIAAALIRWCSLNQCAGAEHQYAQPGDQTIRDFHVARS